MTSIEEKLKCVIYYYYCVYKPEEGKKMSEAKTLHILQRIVPPLVACFDLSASSMSYTKGRVSDLVSYGCSYHGQTIVTLDNEFVSTHDNKTTHYRYTNCQNG